VIKISETAVKRLASEGAQGEKEIVKEIV